MTRWSSLLAFVLAFAALYALARVRSARVTLRTPTVGLAVCALLAIAVGAFRGSTVSLGAATALACAVVCAASDVAVGLIFDGVTLSGAISIAVMSVVGTQLCASVAGAAACAGVMLALYLLTTGRGVGLGDVKLGGVIGAGIGGAESVAAIAAAFIAGALWGMWLLATRRASLGDRVAFAPFLAFGAIAFVASRLAPHG
ncbi:MAG TPA: prepilin peptidase [Candidatus Acidoferrales bacterium]|nr:prepilin peptidase [Candidatus Acidoferrales bacterium]